MMDSEAASSLLQQLQQHGDRLVERVTTRLLAAFPELTQMLKLEGNITVEERLRRVSSERFLKLVQAILLFETFDIADQEFEWASGVLPRSGVSYKHQAAMVRWFFDEAEQLSLTADELATLREVRQHLVKTVDRLYRA
jgi:hypothetical protein